MALGSLLRQENSCRCSDVESVKSSSGSISTTVTLTIQNPSSQSSASFVTSTAFKQSNSSSVAAITYSSVALPTSKVFQSSSSLDRSVVSPSSSASALLPVSHSGSSSAKTPIIAGVVVAGVGTFILLVLALIYLSRRTHSISVTKPLGFDSSDKFTRDMPGTEGTAPVEENIIETISKLFPFLY